MRRAKVLTIFSVALLGIDRLTKWMVFDDLELVRNFKLFVFSINKYILIAIIGAVIVLFLLLFLKSLKRRNAYLSFGYLLIIFGGVSNFFDRIYYGYVIDWINIWMISFNIADLMIIGGIICLTFHLRRYI